MSVIPQVSISSIPTNYLEIILVVIAILLTVRVYRGIKGIKYSTTMVYRVPVTYLALVAVDMAAINPSITEIIAAVVALILGYLLGRGFAGGAKFFEKNNATYYTRSPTIMVIWLISFMARFAIEYFYPTSLALSVIVEIVLAGTTGMIVGEAHHIIKAYNTYKGNSKPSGA